MRVVLRTRTLLEIARLKYRRSIHDSTIKSFVVILQPVSIYPESNTSSYKNYTSSYQRSYYYSIHFLLSVIINYKLLFVKGNQIILLGMNPHDSRWYLYLHLYLYLYLYLYDSMWINLSQESRIKKTPGDVSRPGLLLVI